MAFFPLLSICLFCSENWYEYGRVDKYSACQQLIYGLQIGLAALAVYITCNASPWCYVPIAVLALVAVFMVVGAIHDMFYTQTKWPSPDFDEASTEKVVNNVGLNAEDNSQKISNALA
ncbi:MAG: hypothetical protein O7157_02560 [Wolbachia endosymbiont of Tetragnatha montana]|nr:hypothetical protein [Wolbachia endosymbiont of Tetragnatha montana]